MCHTPCEILIVFSHLQHSEWTLLSVSVKLKKNIKPKMSANWRLRFIFILYLSSQMPAKGKKTYPLLQAYKKGCWSPFCVSQFCKNTNSIRFPCQHFFRKTGQDHRSNRWSWNDNAIVRELQFSDGMFRTYCNDRSSRRMMICPVFSLWSDTGWSGSRSRSIPM